jgi:hypothetical protein
MLLPAVLFKVWADVLDSLQKQSQVVEIEVVVRVELEWLRNKVFSKLWVDVTTDNDTT